MLLDDTNPDSEDSTGEASFDWLTDYDPDYWSPVYDRIRHLNMDSRPPSAQQGKLKRFAGVAGVLLCSIV